MTATEPTGFLGWTQMYGPILGLYVQILYFVALSVASLWAAKTFSRYVKYMTTEEVEVVEAEYVEEADLSESVESDEDESAEKKKSVDEFVE